MYVKFSFSNTNSGASIPVPHSIPWEHRYECLPPLCATRKNHTQQGRQEALTSGRKDRKDKCFSFDPNPLLRPNRWKHLQGACFSHAASTFEDRHTSFSGLVFANTVSGVSFRGCGNEENSKL
ncbi:hypothetical protein CEXT_303871 [Caerostris extrusa]|uniref:Uncharacterized protein n=1 Tax=Caerostris extrusa TaxID=172846 RepID=A0AAV4SK85_CAEEX|nr:hypothetical protein CEXT_303871 [Caerostris extrusa]